MQRIDIEIRKNEIESYFDWCIVCYAIATVIYIVHICSTCENVNHIQFNYENQDTRMR